MNSNLLQYSDASRKEAIKLIKALENYLPSHLYRQVEFSFQFLQSKNINDFKTYNYNKQEKCFELVDSVKKTEQGHLTKHTHLTRDIKKIKNGPLYYGYNYIHWKVLNEVSKVPSSKEGLSGLVNESSEPTGLEGVAPNLIMDPRFKKKVPLGQRFLVNN